MWKEKAAYMARGVSTVDEAICNYLKSRGDPDKVPLGEIETVIANTGIFKSEALCDIVPEFLIYHGFNPNPIDGYYVKYRALKKC